MHNQMGNRIIAILSVSGAMLLLLGTYLHPMDADPNLAIAAFTEYAADQHWVSTHLLQLFGVAFMVAAIVLASRLFAAGTADAVAAVARAGAIASLAMATALQAVDGIALKGMVDAWAAAPQPDKAGLFHAAFAVRQIETGLASMTALLFGLTTALFGIALLIDARFPKWLGVLAIAAGVPTAAGGVAMAHTGFSGLSMAINMPSNALLLAWIIGFGIHAWNRHPQK